MKAKTNSGLMLITISIITIFLITACTHNSPLGGGRIEFQITLAE
jgi:hypothetical protein